MPQLLSPGTDGPSYSFDLTAAGRSLNKATTVTDLLAFSLAAFLGALDEPTLGAELHVFGAAFGQHAAAGRSLNQPARFAKLLVRLAAEIATFYLSAFGADHHNVGPASFGGLGDRRRFGGASVSEADLHPPAKPATNTPMTNSTVMRCICFSFHRWSFEMPPIVSFRR